MPDKPPPPSRRFVHYLSGKLKVLLKEIKWGRWHFFKRRGNEEKEEELLPILTRLFTRSKGTAF
jgi:hypothetical protein